LVADFGKAMIAMGVIIAMMGVILLLLSRTHLPTGRLPGDIIYRGTHTTVYFPLATSLLLSIVLSLILYFISHFRR
jgi:hypothetical protein